jgi:uncharacterized protein (DUF2147 family)
MDCPGSPLHISRNRCLTPETGLAYPSRRIAYAVVLIIVLWWLAVPTTTSSAMVPDGVWFIDSNSALQTFDCDGLLCGRVAWLRNVHDPMGRIQRDKKNPDPALRQRLVCGLTVVWGLQPVGSDKWKGGWLYNPDDGNTYGVAAEIRSDDTMVARIYLGLPAIGTTKTFRRFPRINSEGWC